MHITKKSPTIFRLLIALLCLAGWALLIAACASPAGRRTPAGPDPAGSVARERLPAGDPENLAPAQSEAAEQPSGAEALENAALEDEQPSSVAMDQVRPEEQVTAAAPTASPEETPDEATRPVVQTGLYLPSDTALIAATGKFQFLNFYADW